MAEVRRGWRPSVWLPALVWMAVIFYASHQPAVEIPFGAPDYVAHAASYAVLGATYLFALTRGRVSGASWSLAAIATVLGLGYGLTDEFHQSFIPGRFPSGSDVVADLVGAAIGSATVVVAAQERGRRRPGTAGRPTRR